MRNRRSRSERTPAELHRTPIITNHLIIREATRGDAQAIESTMDAAELEAGERTPDGARRFGSGLAEVPVWSATRAICEKGSARIVGGVVLNEMPDTPDEVWRIGWWLDAAAAHYAPEVIAGVDERLQAMGADRIVMHVRADDDGALGAAEGAGFRRGDAVQHATVTGRQLDFWEYVRP